MKYSYLGILCVCSCSPLLSFKGYKDLLDRRYNEVTFAATHNGQSHLPPTKDTLIPVQNQVKPVTDQLQAGIRAMKIPLFEQEWQGKTTVIATHGINEGVKGQVKTLVDNLFKQYTEQETNKKAQEQGLAAKIDTAQKTFDTAKSVRDAAQNAYDKFNYNVMGKKGNKAPQEVKNALNAAKDVFNKAETALNTLKNERTALGAKLAEELKNKAEPILKTIGISEKVLNIYYHPEKVKPSDLDPAGRPFEDIAKDIKKFLDTNKSEIVTLFLEVYNTTPQSILAVFKATQADQYLYKQDTKQPWPTLRELIAQNKRLIVFVDKPVDQTLPLNNFTDFVWDSAYLFTNLFALISDNGSSKKPDASWLAKNNRNAVYQHFISSPTGGSLKEAPYANKKNIIINRVNRYKNNFGILPNFIWLDFFDTAPLTEDQLKKQILDFTKLTLDDMKNLTMPVLQPADLKTQQDVFDAVDEINGMWKPQAALGS